MIVAELINFHAQQIAELIGRTAMGKKELSLFSPPSMTFSSIGFLFVISTIIVTGNSMPIQNTGGRETFEKIFGPPPGKFCETTHGTTHYILQEEEKKDTSSPPPPLVILKHGLGGDSGRFDRIANDLVSHGYRVLRYDFYDRGYSETDPKRYPILRKGVHPLKFTADIYVQQLEDVLRHLFGEDSNSVKFILVGHSMGGLVGTCYAAKHPDQVLGLCLIAAVCLPVQKPLLAKIANLPVIGDFLAEKFGAATFKKFSRGSVVDPDNHDDIKNFLQKQSDNVDANARFFSSVRSTNQNCKGMVGSAEEEFRICCQASIPIHLVWGTADASVPYTNCCKMKQIAEEIGTSVTEEIFDDMPHNIYFEDAKPKECSKSICDFAIKVCPLE